MGVSIAGSIYNDVRERCFVRDWIKRQVVAQGRKPVSVGMPLPALMSVLVDELPTWYLTTPLASSDRPTKFCNGP